MKSNPSMNSVLVVLLLLFSANSLLAFSNDPKGTWNYEVSQTPPEYAKGKLIITENDGKLEGVITIGEHSINLLNVKSEGNELSFGAYVEGEYVTVKLTLDGKSFSGTANSSNGISEITGKKEE